MQYVARINWKRKSLPFTVKSYDRTHQINFGSGTSMTASSAPEFLGNSQLPNPEELFTASLASCFMLTFLYWAATKGLVVEEYDAEAVGTLAKNAEGKMAVTQIVLKPKVTFQHPLPDAQMLDELCKKAHENCFISCSVKTNVIVQAETVTA